MRILQTDEICEFKIAGLKCTDPATKLTYDVPERYVGAYCNAHAELVIDKTSFVFTDSCQNCKCYMGIDL